MIGQSAGKDYAYILGVYLGDGCVTTTGTEKTPVFRLNTIDADFAEAVADALERLTGVKPNINRRSVKRGSDNYAISRVCRPLTGTLVADTSGKLEIPSYVFSWGKGLKLAFIAGLMDSEGFVGANKNPTNRRYYMGFKCTSEWVPDFIRILNSVGIKTGKIGYEAPRKPGYRAPIRFTIKMQSWIDAGGYFNIQRKQRRVLEWAESGPYERRAIGPRKSTSETTRQTPATVMI